MPLPTVSPPVWVAWIEILPDREQRDGRNRRHPYGWRGLKYKLTKKEIWQLQSPPVWVAWIEMIEEEEL